MASYVTSPGYQRRSPIRRPKLDAFVSTIFRWRDEAWRCRVSNGTPRSVFDHLREKCGLTGGSLSSRIVCASGISGARKSSCRCRTRPEVRGELSAGGFVGFLLLIGVLFRPIDKINSIIETYPKGIAGFTRYTQFLDTEPDIRDREDVREVGRLAGDIEYRAVGFGYRTERPLFGGLDLSVRAGETIAFVGPSARRAPARRRSIRCCRASTTSKCSTTRNANTSGTECCRP